MIAITALAIFFTAAAICYVCEHHARILQSLGFGFVVYHSDSQKHFWSLTCKDAMQWMACALGDAVLIHKRLGETLAIRFAA